MIKILTGWSNKGGSTFTFINLVNALNDCGHDATLYGPHDWHMDKCKAGKLANLTIDKDDSIITHFLALEKRPDCKRVVLNCHETDVFDVGGVKKHWDKVVFLNEKQRRYHSKYYGPYEIIPNLREGLERKEKDPSVKNVAGIIGSIDKNKQTHVSIMRALHDSCDTIYLFGNVTDVDYYQNEVKPLIDENDNVIEYGFIGDKEKMYSMVGRVYLSSKREVAPLVKDECETNGTEFYGNYATNHDVKDLTNDEIIKEWLKILEV